MRFKVWNKEKTEIHVDYSLIRDKSRREDGEEEDEQTEDLNITEGYESGLHLQIIELPDFQYIPGHDKEKYYVAEREPKEVRSDDNRTYSISPIRDIRGPYDRQEAFNELILLYNQASIPAHENIRILRPVGFDDYYYWISCPDCQERTEIDTELKIQSDRRKSSLKIECTNCEKSVTNEAQSRGSLEKWSACPICGSSSINYKCSIPYGFVNFSCDDCDYNTKPSKIDDGFSELEIDLSEFADKNK